MRVEVKNWSIKKNDHLWLENSKSGDYKYNDICDGCHSKMKEIARVTNFNSKLGLVTGLCFAEKGHKVIAVDNFMYQQTSLLDCCHYENFSLINGDVRNADLINKQMKQVDAILPLACLTGAPLCDKDPLTARAVNFEGIETILSKRSPNQIIIFPTTNSGYGVGEKGIYCTEETPLLKSFNKRLKF